MPTMLYYRGEAEEFPELTPSVMRSSRSAHYPLRNDESELLVDLSTRRPEDFADESSALGQLMIAQHHGLPTRLLDITRNPLVALFHATAERRPSGRSSDGRLHLLAVPRSIVKPYSSHTVRVMANFTKLTRGEQNLLLTKTTDFTDEDHDHPPLRSPVHAMTPGGYLMRPHYTDYSSAMSRLVQFVRSENPSFEDRIDPRDFFRVLVVEPQQSFERIRAQSGTFLLSAFHERFDAKVVQWVNDLIPTYHHYTTIVPRQCKDRIRNQLKNLYITEETMFPGLETATEAVKIQHGGGT